MQQRRPTTPSHYQPVTPDETKPDVPALFTTTFTEDAVSRACYIRALDLLTLFSEVLKVGSDNIPAGTAGNVVNGIYKGVTQVALPFWKTCNEMNNHGAFNKKITFAHVLNVVDTLLSAASFVAWIIGTVNDDKNALAASKYLLAAAMVMHLLKDTIQKYQTSQTESIEKKALEKRLSSLEQGHTILISNDGILQANDKALQTRVQALEQKVPEVEARVGGLTSQRR